MASIDSIHKKLQLAAEQLDLAAAEIRDLPLEPSKQHIRAIGEALGNVFQIQHEIYGKRPDLKPAFLTEQSQEPDGELTLEQIALVEKLTDEEVNTIDQALFAATSDKWRKVARVIGTVMLELPHRIEGIPDIYYSKRVRKLVLDGRLESQGNLAYMRYSEIRRPCGKET